MVKQLTNDERFVAYQEAAANVLAERDELKVKLRERDTDNAVLRALERELRDQNRELVAARDTAVEAVNIANAHMGNIMHSCREMAAATQKAVQFNGAVQKAQDGIKPEDIAAKFAPAPKPKPKGLGERMTELAASVTG